MEGVGDGGGEDVWGGEGMGGSRGAAKAGKEGAATDGVVDADGGRAV